MRRALFHRCSVLAFVAGFAIAPGLSAASPPADRGTNAPTGSSEVLSSDTAPPDTIPPRYLIEPDELGRLLAGPPAGRPTLLHVGFKALYRGGHIPGSRYVGPASKPEGIDSLRRALRALRKDTPLILYCGCCPWKDCPNVHPAFRTAQAMGCQRVKVLFVGQNLQRDWIDKGLPISERAP